MSGKIIRLPQDVINKIAAGEIVLNPFQVVKEMVENSIDAGATAVEVVLQDAGLKMIEISDNGCGIDADDFPLLCEKHATSKIQTYDDMRNVSTFGFRGEALASISYVSKMVVKTKKKENEFGVQGQFENGALKFQEGQDELEMIFKADGTDILVKDLFYNVPLRKTAIDQRDQLNKVRELLTKLAVHHYDKEFTLKDAKDGTKSKTVVFSSSSINRKGRSSLEVRSDVLQKTLGDNISRNLLELVLPMQDLSCNCYILLTKPDHKIRGKHLYLFINDRLVECDSIKEAIESAYLNCRMNIHDLHGDYFAYVDFRIAKENIDVNIHPNKKKVHIANEDLIAERIKETVEEYIKDNKNIKQFTANQKIRQSYFRSDSLDLEKEPEKKEESKKNNQNAMEEEKVYAKSLVRTDPKSQRIDKFLSNSASLSLDRGKSPSSKVNDSSVCTSQNMPQNSKLEASEELLMIDDTPTKQGLKTPFRNEELDNLLRYQRLLLNELNENQNAGVKKFFQQLVYVGSSGKSQLYFQFEQQLLLLNPVLICEELFYHMSLLCLGQFRIKKLEKPISIRKLLKEAIKNPENDYDPQNHPPAATILEKYTEKIMNISKELNNYFGIQITESDIVALPIIHEQFVYIRREDIGSLLLRICSEVEQEEDKAFIQGVCKELGYYFAKSLESDQFLTEEDRESFDAFFQDDILQFMKTIALPSSQLEKPFALSLIRLEEMYKIFERC